MSIKDLYRNNVKYSRIPFVKNTGKKIRDIFVDINNNNPIILRTRYHAFQDDRKYIEKTFLERVGYKPNLDNPSTLCEKLNWLKLYNRRPEYTMMVDKYLVKKICC